MPSSVAFERVNDEEIVLNKYAETKEEAFNLLFSGMLIHRGDLMSEQVTKEIYLTYPPTLVTEEEFTLYGKWVSSGEINNVILRAKNEFSMSLEKVMRENSFRPVGEVMEKLDQKFHEFEDIYINGINYIIDTISCTLRKKLITFTTT